MAGDTNTNKNHESMQEKQSEVTVRFSVNMFLFYLLHLSNRIPALLRTKKYFEAPFLVLQLVTNRGLK